MDHFVKKKSKGANVDRAFDILESVAFSMYQLSFHQLQEVGRRCTASRDVAH